MTRLTVTEKDHWKSRIEARTDRAIEHLKASDLKLVVQLNTDVEYEAHKAMGTDALFKEHCDIKHQIKALESQLKSVERSIHRHAAGSGCSKPDSDHDLSYKFNQMLERHKKLASGAILSRSPTGRAILRLQEEKEAILDTVWLATSSKQIRDLWSKVADVLQDDCTDLQKQILSSSDDNQA